MENLVRGANQIESDGPILFRDSGYKEASSEDVNCSTDNPRIGVVNIQNVLFVTTNVIIFGYTYLVDLRYSTYKNGMPALSPNIINRIPLTGLNFAVAKHSIMVNTKHMVDEVVIRLR